MIRGFDISSAINKLSLSWDTRLGDLLAGLQLPGRGTIGTSYPRPNLLSSNLWLITTSLAMMVCFLLRIPNAVLLLLAAVVHSALSGGWKAGLASATLSSFYSAIFFSRPGQLFHYTPFEFRQLLTMIAVGYGVVLIVGERRRRDRTALERRLQRQDAESIELVGEEMFRTMADGAPVLLWMADPAGRRFFFNRPWLDFTARTREEQAGDGWHKSVHPDDLAECLHRWTVAVREGVKFEAEYRLLDANGDYRWLQDFGVPRFSKDSQLLGYIGSCADRTERKRVERALHQLSGRLLELQDDERRRIARELHDTTAQNLAVLSMNLCVIKDLPQLSSPKAQQVVSESLALAEQCSQEIRTVSYLLHPPLLDELGLVSALRSYARGFTQRTGIPVELKIQEIGRLPRDIEITVFRIVQEALTNVHRHSGSAKAEVRLLRDPFSVKVQVNDEGKGIPPESLHLLGEGANLGVGIAGMRERASQLGGQLKIGSSDNGTTISAILPLGANV